MENKISGLCFEKLKALELTWGRSRQYGVKAALTITFEAGWISVIKEASKQILMYGSRKVLGAISGVVFGYLGTTSIVLITKSAKIVKYAKVCY